MTDYESPILKQWLMLQTDMHRFLDSNFKRMGPMGAPQRGQGLLLRIISDNPNISQKQICEACPMRQQSVSELLKKLENAGYITRKISSEDKRTYLFNLTEEGKKFASPPREVVESVNSFFDCLNEEEQQNMSDYLMRIRYNIEKISQKNN